MAYSYSYTYTYIDTDTHTHTYTRVKKSMPIPGSLTPFRRVVAQRGPKGKKK